MSKSIVIGANGYIGRNLAFYIRSLNEECFCFDVQETSFDDLNVYKKLDITNWDSVSKLNVDVDYIFLFAGLTGTSQGFDNYHQYIDINEKGLLNILTRMKETSSRAKIVFPSTRLVYKGLSGVSLKEEAEKETKTIYALNKLACEYILEMYRNAFGINYTIFRICVPYGSMIEGATSYGTIGFFLQNAANGKDINLYGDGALRRTFTNVRDICRKIKMANQDDNSNHKIYNIGGENFSLLEVATKIALKYSVNIKFADWPPLTYKIESGDTVFDSSHLDELLQDNQYRGFDKWLEEK